MPLVGEKAWHTWAYSEGDYYTASWDLDLAPSAAFIKVFLVQYYEFGDQSAVHAGLLDIRFRDQNGVDQTITFPNLDNVGFVSTQFNPTMTHVTFGLKVRAAMPPRRRGM
jgi:hypothetical protein